MKRNLLLLIVCSLALLAMPAAAVPGDLRIARVAKLAFPTGMAFTASGDRLFVNERSGRVRLIFQGRLDPQPVATIGTTTAGEGGLLGIALHPQFESGQPWLYVFFTRPGGRTDRVERLRIEKNRVAARQVVLDGLEASGYHHGGILAFGPDGKLYVSHGESHDTDRAQKPGVLGGKIYRLNPDGSVPADNPFRSAPAFAYGIRNPFGMAFDPQSGLLWETENGPSNHDEVNIIERGKNYGWPVVSGRSDRSEFTNPVRDYVDTIVPTMAAFGGDALPLPYRGNFFFGSYGERAIRRLVLTDNRRGIAREEILHRADAPVVGMTMGPDGLYYSTPNAVFRISGSAASASGSASGSASPSPSLQPSGSAPSPSAAGSGESGRALGPLLGLASLIGIGLAATLLLVQRRNR